MELNVSLYLTAIIFFLASILKFWQHSTKNYPPGPKGLPLFGYAMFIFQKPHKAIARLRRSYGDIVKVNIAGIKVIFLLSHKSIKEAFITQGDSFSGRPSRVDPLAKITHAKGIIANQGRSWSNFRRFSFAALKDVGFGKTMLEPKIKEEVTALIQKMKYFNGKPLYFIDWITQSITTSVLHLLFGIHLNFEDKTLTNIIHLINGFTSHYHILDISHVIPHWILKMLKIKTSMYYAQKLLNKFAEISGQLEMKSMNSKNIDSGKSFVQAWFEAIHKQEAQAKHFNEQELSRILFDLLVAGSDTTSHAVNWAILYMIKYPDVQRKVQAEIDSVVGIGRIPSLSDRKKMPYTEAVLLELTRHITVIPFPVPHCTTVDAWINGYFIPARHIIISNQWAVHFDPELFPEPNKFKPDRFLDNFNEVKHIEELIPFSLGKRRCPGETFALMQTFLYFTSLLQQFTFETVDGIEVDFGYTLGTARKANRQQICAIERAKVLRVS